MLRETEIVVGTWYLRHLGVVTAKLCILAIGDSPIQRYRATRGAPTFYKTLILSKVTAPRVMAFQAFAPKFAPLRPAKCQKCPPQWCLRFPEGRPSGELSEMAAGDTTVGSRPTCGRHDTAASCNIGVPDGAPDMMLRLSCPHLVGRGPISSDEALEGKERRLVCACRARAWLADRLGWRGGGSGGRRRRCRLWRRQVRKPVGHGRRSAKTAVWRSSSYPPRWSVLHDVDNRGEQLVGAFVQSRKAPSR